MIVRLIRDDTWGGTLVEFTVTLPFFLLLMFGLIQAGLLLWTQAGLQHGVEVATRCASVNYSANQLGLNTSCFIVDGAAVAPSTVCGGSPGCDSATATPYIQKYAAQNSFGLVPSFSSFTVTQTLPPRRPLPDEYRLSGHRERPVQFDKLYFLGDTHSYIQIFDQLQLSRVDRPSVRGSSARSSRNVYRFWTGLVIFRPLHHHSNDRMISRGLGAFSARHGRMVSVGERTPMAVAGWPTYNLSHLVDNGLHISEKSCGRNDIS